MSLCRAVQFKRADEVVQAYVNRKVPAFAIYCGKQFLFWESPANLEEGERALEEYLQLLEKAQGSGIYSLVLYEDVEPGDRIRSNMPYDGSFNFQFRENYGQYSQRPDFSENREILSKLEAMQMEIQSLKEEKDEEVNEDAIGRVLNNPVIQRLPEILQSLPEVIGAIKAMFRSENPAPMRAVPGEHDIPASQKISGIVFKDPNNMTDDEKLQEAIRILREKTKDLPALLYKLAMLSIKNPIQYGIYTVGLRTMRV